MKTMKFRSGQIVATPAALDALSSGDIQAALRRHFDGGWNDCAPEDREANDFALLHDERPFSVYHAGNGTKFWVITESDRSATTVLLPDDY